ncbi:hypothetical protein OWR29_26425 [Actinoplanes sp. Pm04-4]|uniref:Uncharacterized protein n=1 Tax=Paractinoplanes pyxinae TaxID=2997416 RepID=A0ABT4B4W9_9ACTN|nr:hypothetical protein [Actinoplanes pyxinae]MCY1141549.1 hypothetical protein [Actinoplanes pyxinae]
MAVVGVEHDAEVEVEGRSGSRVTDCRGHADGGFESSKALKKVRQVIDSDPTDDRDVVRELYQQAREFCDRISADPAAVREELIADVGDQKRRRKIPLSG